MAQPGPFANDLDALVSLISSSVEVIKAAYAQAGSPVPSLDSIHRSPFDAGRPSPELRKAIQIIHGACTQLSTTVSNPYSALLNITSEGFTASCLRLVTETKVAAILETAGTKGMPASILSDLTGIESGKLSRILRLLATKHIFKEVDTDVFANNRLSILLGTDEDMASLVSYSANECNRGAVHVYDTLTDANLGASYAAEDAPVTKALDIDKGNDIFWWLSQRRPDRGAAFGRAMVAWGKLDPGTLPNAYLWSDLPNGTTIVDVGGGVGSASMEISRAHPHLKFVVQDLPQVVQRGQELWRKEYPEALEEGRIRFQPLDFFKESPIENQDIYYIRHVIHDWPDKESLLILQNVRKAMKPGSRVLIHENILQQANRVPDKQALFPQAPEPLLPNYGAGKLRQYTLDYTMLILTNSKERSLQEYINLCKQAGLAFLNVYDTGEASVVEFMAKEMNGHA